MSEKRGATASENIKLDDLSSTRQVLPICLALVTLVAFAITCMFWLKLTTGQWVMFSGESFRSSLLAPLGQMLPLPLRVVNFPWMIPVYAMVLAVLVFVPIGAAGAYRLPLSGIFVLLLGLVAQVVYLAMAVMIGCTLVARRRDTKRMSMLLLIGGLAWPGAFLLMVAWLRQVPADVQPIQRWLPVSWQLFAVTLALLGCITIATSNSIRSARWVIPILLAIFLAGAGAIFHLRVTFSELDYALIDRQLHTAESIFAPVTLEQWQREREHPKQQDVAFATLASAVRDDLANRRMEIINQCRQFYKDHPQSKRAPAAVWIMGQCQSLQLDEAALAVKQVRFSTDFTTTESKDTWDILVDVYTTSPISALGRWRLAEWYLKRGGLANIKKAENLLFAGRDGLVKILSESTDSTNGTGRLFSPRASLPPLAYYRHALDRVTLLLWWISENAIVQDDGNVREGKAITAFMRVSPLNRNYVAQLAGLLKGANNFSDTAMAGNIAMAIALREDNIVTKTRQLARIAAGNDDAAIHANYRLGLILVTNPELKTMLSELLKDKTPAKCFKRVAVDYKPSPWQKDAEIKYKQLDNKSE